MVCARAQLTDREDPAVIAGQATHLHLEVHNSNCACWGPNNVYVPPWVKSPEQESLHKSQKRDLPKHRTTLVKSEIQCFANTLVTAR
jgi:hypothetical protein